MTKIITISIFKGGTGKTTTSVSIASALSLLGKKTLLLDLDQQASATRHLGIDPDSENPNLFHVFMQQVPAAMAVKKLRPNFSLIPGNSLLAAIEESLEEGDEQVLKKLLTGLMDQFDYLILDTPPGKAMLSINALSAANEVIIPLQAERPALDGVQDLLRFIQEIVWDKYNPGLQILGILPTMFKRTTIHSAGVVKKAREIWGNKVFPFEIPESIAFPRAFERSTPLPLYDPSHEGAQLYRKVARIIANQ